MDRIENYHDVVRQLVEEYASETQLRDGTTVEPVTDLEHGHYQVMRLGWVKGRYVHSCLVHFVVRGGRVHLLKNDTDVEWDRELVAHGIAPDDIVLAFRQVHPRAMDAPVPSC
jgi:hypothetical protein